MLDKLFVSAELYPSLVIPILGIQPFLIQNLRNYSQNSRYALQKLYSATSHKLFLQLHQNMARTVHLYLLFL